MTAGKAMSSSSATAPQGHDVVAAALHGTLEDEEFGAPGQERKGHALPTDVLETTLQDAARARRQVWRRARVHADTGDTTDTPRQRTRPATDEDEPTTAHASQKVAARGLQILERWDGIVQEVGESTFTARLLDQKSGRPRAETEVFIGEVPPYDRPLLKPGAVFYWHIGYRDPEGDHERVSRIRFRRLPPKTRADLKRAELAADKIRSQFGWE